jgi:hypothetical protein
LRCRGAYSKDVAVKHGHKESLTQVWLSKSILKFPLGRGITRRAGDHQEWAQALRSSVILCYCFREISFGLEKFIVVWLASLHL